MSKWLHLLKCELYQWRRRSRVLLNRVKAEQALVRAMRPPKLPSPRPSRGGGKG